MKTSLFRKLTAALLAVLTLVTVFSCAGCSKLQSAHKAPIVVLGPMECEYLELTETLDDVKTTVSGNYTFFEGTLDGSPVVVVNCLVGMVNSAAAATIAIEKYDPRCVIIQGTSGGHDPALHKNDILLGEDILETGSYYTPHRDKGDGICPEDWEFPGVEMLIDGKVERVRVMHSDEELMKIAESVPYDSGTLTRGTIGTGDLWNKEIDRINYFHEQLGTDCEEMEGFAVAQVCDSFGVPMLAIRIISNSELHPEEVFSEESGRICQRYCADVIRAIAAQS